MYAVTNGLAGEGIVKLLGWSSRDHPKQRSETIDDMAQCRIPFSSCIICLLVLPIVHSPCVNTAPETVWEF